MSTKPLAQQVVPGADGAESATAEDGAVRPRDSLFHWCGTVDAIRQSTKRVEKSALLEAYFESVAEQTIAPAARFFSGVIFPRHDVRTIRVGWSLVVDAIQDLSHVHPVKFRDRYIKHGDLGDAVAEVFAGRLPSGIAVEDIATWTEALATTTEAETRRVLMRDMLARLSALEAQYLVKLIGGKLRIGIKEAQVEEALANTFGQPLAAVRRANLLRGDIGEVARLTRRRSLDDARLALFHPIGFMLPQELPASDEIVSTLAAPFAVEDKYDGARVQAHIARDRVTLFSRSLEDITYAYPDVVAALAGLGGTASLGSRAEGSGFVIDGQLLAVDPDEPTRVRPFDALHQRLGRKAPDASLVRATPAAFVAFDLLAAPGVNGEPTLVIDEPYSERRDRLSALPWPGPRAPAANGEAPRAGAWVMPVRLLSTVAEVEQAFDEARAAGKEGIVVKQIDSAYTPGRRGKTWIKLERDDAVV